ncbi:MAG: hypothetical protein AB1714_02610 [Acidobacteriota bacterium]
MRTASVRDVQHNLAGFLRQVEQGQEFEIRRRDAPVARLVPVSGVVNQRADWSDIGLWRDRIWGRRAAPGRPASQIVYESRDR